MQTRGPGERGRKEEPGAGRQDAGDEGGAAGAPPPRPGRRRWRDSSCWFARPRTATETRMGRFGLVLAFCLAELMVMSLAQNSTTPYIAGLWEFEYSYDELLGPLDNQIVNPCRGPFPYKYRFNYYIYQETIETNGTIKATGNIRTCKYEFEDCIAKAKPKEIVLGSVRHITDKCTFQPKNEHQFDLNQYPGYFAEGYIKELFPTDKDNKPVTRKLWSRFQIPKQVPYVYGVFCDQTAWQDVSTEIKVTPPYDGSWRYDNETWVIVRDISTCPCFPRCSECEEKLPGTNIKQVKEDGGVCLAKYNVEPHECQNIIIGVSGGPNVYPTSTTGYPADDFGDPQICFAYATIKAKRQPGKGPKDLPEVRSAEWGTIGELSKNPPPPKA